jgi:D-glycero-alpha-D-manno-heptose-7-phosphate kinase
VKKTIRSTAPARIDLAGGTLDIPPLYLFEEFGLTVNAAINMGSEVTVTLRDDCEIHMTAADLGVSQTAPCLAELDLHGSLPLLARAVRHYLKGFDGGIDVVTRNKAPKGSGLGASSCLLMTLSGALNHLTGKGLSKKEMVHVASHLEAQVIGIPTGLQDYFAAAFGGVNALWFEPGEDRVEGLGDEAIEELNQRIVLSYTGETRFSGTSNWIMMCRYIDNADGERDRLRAIKRTAIEMRDAIARRDWEHFAAQVAEEWDNRRNLARGVTTPRIDAMMASAASNGALASKICGAGGGGCMISVIRPEDREPVNAAITAAGGHVLPFQVEKQGLTITEA